MIIDQKKTERLTSCSYKYQLIGKIFIFLNKENSPDCPCYQEIHLLAKQLLIGRICVLWHHKFVIKCSYQAFMHSKYFLNHFEIHLTLPGYVGNP